ncbi:MAG: hypothetical protein AAF490_24855 [Chloroflexota bacterium]
MEKNIYRFILSLFVVAAVGYGVFWTSVPVVDEQYEVASVPPELENQVFHWRYNIGWDFRVLMDEEGLHWEGFAGDFEGQTATVDPRYTKVQESLYFITWNVPYIGYDSLVLDFENNLVYAHSKGNSKSVAIAGEIYCNGFIESCEPPRQQ